MNNLLYDVDKLANLNNIYYSTKFSPYKTMEYNLGGKAGFPYTTKGIYTYEQEKPNYHYEARYLKPDPLNEYNGKKAIYYDNMNNRKVDILGMLYDVDTLKIYKNEVTVKQY